MEARVGPILGSRHVPVLHRIPVDVVHVSSEVGVIAYQVLPVPSLSDTAFAFVDTPGASMLPKRQVAREPSLDESPAEREIGIFRWQGPDGVEVVGKNDHCVNDERVSLLRIADRLPQQIDVVDQQRRTPVGEIDGEEVRWHPRRRRGGNGSSLTS